MPFHTSRHDDGVLRPYWDESAYYAFTPAEAAELERATDDLHALCLEVVQHVVDERTGRHPDDTGRPLGSAGLTATERLGPAVGRSRAEKADALYRRSRSSLGSSKSAGASLPKPKASAPAAGAAVLPWASAARLAGFPEVRLPFFFC